MQPVESLKILKKTYPNAKYYLHFKTPLQLLVAAILSAQVRDEVVNATTPVLFKKFKTAKDFANATPSEIEKIISKITFAKNKAKHINAACKLLVEKFNSKVPKDIDDLVSLPGVGRKTANAILQNAYNIVLGIPCDTHVLRVSFRLGWTSNKNPDKVEKDLMNKFDKKWWSEIPHLLKAHGRAVCKAPVPYCSKCPLKSSCPKKGVSRSL